jgi:uncharacterized protein
MKRSEVEVEVRDVPGAGRYELHGDGRLLGYASYRVTGGRAMVPHVEVDRALEGRGLGGRLVQGMLDDLRRRDLKVTPMCPFAAAWIRRHPEYQDLVA